MVDPSELSHLDERGNPRMVDVGDKAITLRTARAEAVVRMNRETAEALAARSLKKGDAFTVAQIAGIQAAKETSRLIPLCHPLPLDKIDVDFESPDPDPDNPEKVLIRVTSFLRCEAKTGVEMEALTAVSVAALALYDMCKAIDRRMEVASIRLVEKTGGKEDFRG
jgi:cyclic pyranopterin phosphate synthase